MPLSPDAFDASFRDAVAAMDTGDVPELQRLLHQAPELLSARLETPGPWLTEKVGRSLAGFFARPYLLWFVAEDPVRNDRLPPNIVEVATVLVSMAAQARVGSLQEQLDTTLRLVAWSSVAARAGVQIPLLDLLIDAGAAPDQNAHNALVNGHLAAAAHLIQRGGTATLATAVCLGDFAEASRLAVTATPAEAQFALVLAALNGRAEGVAWLLQRGVPANDPCPDLYPHGSPLHHAVASGSLDTVRVLVEGGADLSAADTAWSGTPLGWALYYVDSVDAPSRERYRAIADYLASRRPSAG